MSELPAAYSPKDVEEKWYTYWIDNDFFKADPHSLKKPYCIVIPPPNVTGVLHMGHALVNTLQDILIRWKRMSGYEALWVPGTDHAGIATQTVVERHLIKTRNKKRKDFSREEFLKEVWAWKEKSENEILNQLKKLGTSCDWSRLHFTMDETCSHSVRKVFKKMFDENLIYQGDYLVNWDPVTETALADDEVEHEEKDSFLWYIRYPLENGSHVIIATTRPETMLGDTAIAYSPKDDRYEDFKGQFAIHPFLERKIPFVADHHIDPSFGSGLVKITPAHDFNDYEIALRHSLPMINIMTPDGKINENGGKFCGLTMQEARSSVVDELKKLGLIEKIEPHRNRIGVSYRSKAVIEPYLSKQWFVRMTAFKDKLTSAVKDERVKLVPRSFENTYFHWIDNLRDWCISRQLWWGHRIPIWYNKNDRSQVICYDGLDEPDEVKKDPQNWYQDEDVLDTWFSAALWPFTVLGYPENTADLKKFYPTSTLVTGHDILFFWVARMIMMGEYVMGEVPFSETFLHGLIYGKSYWRIQKDGSIAYASPEERDSYDSGKPLPFDVHAKWEKMSKSKGNIIDPLEMIDKYGTDALRMALCASAGQSRQIDLDLRRFEEFKNFANKIWNGTRFAMMHLSSLTKEELAKGIDPSKLTLEDKWILSLLDKTIQDVTNDLTNYHFDGAALKGYDFFWKEFCAYYLEIAKPTLFDKEGTPVHKANKQKIMVIILCSMMRLIHPIAPFITEEIFSLLKERFTGTETLASVDEYTKDAIYALNQKACIIAPYPVSKGLYQDESIGKDFTSIQEIVYAIRNVRAEMQIPPGVSTDVFLISSPNEATIPFIKNNIGMIKALVKVKDVHFVEKAPEQGCSSTSVIGNFSLLLPLPEEMREKEILRLTKERDKLISQQTGMVEKLSNQDFIQRAPAPLVEKHKQMLLQTEKELVEISKKLNDLSF